jgi:hypothetical protein
MGKALNTAIDASFQLGTGGAVGYSDGGFKRGIVAEGVNKATGGDLSKIGNSLKDTLLGKKTPGTPDEVIDLADPEGRRLQSELLAQYGNQINQDTSGIAQQQITAQENQLLQNAKDQEMRAQQLVAQRGLGRTASGIGAILNQQRGLSDQVSAVRAQLPGLQQQMKQQQLGFATGGINQILNEQGQSKVLKLGQQAQPRSGGLLAAALPIAGQVLGGMAGAGAFGGAAGAAGAAGGAAGGSMAGYNPGRYSMGAF